MFIYKVILITITCLFILTILIHTMDKEESEREDIVILGIFIAYLIYLILS